MKERKQMKVWRKLNSNLSENVHTSELSLVQLPKTAIAVSDDIAVFGDIVPYPIAENGDILENSVNT